MAGQYIAARRQEIVAAVRAGAAVGAGLSLHRLGVVPAAAAAVLGDAGEVLLARFAAYLADEWGPGCGDGVELPVPGAAVRRSARRCCRPVVLAGCRPRTAPPGCARRSAQVRANSLHILLGFMWQEGLTAFCAGRSGRLLCRAGCAAPPRRLNPGQGGDLLAAVRSGGPDGVRNEPMVVLTVRLALRAREVASLLLEDIDWRSRGAERARQGNCLDQMPLPADVGQPLAKYLRHGRPAGTAHRQAFLARTLRTGRWRPRRWQASPPAPWPTPGSRAGRHAPAPAVPRRAGASGNRRISHRAPARSRIPGLKASLPSPPEQADLELMQRALDRTAPPPHRTAPPPPGPAVGREATVNPLHFRGQ